MGFSNVTKQANWLTPTAFMKSVRVEYVTSSVMFGNFAISICEKLRILGHLPYLQKRSAQAHIKTNKKNLPKTG